MSFEITNPAILLCLGMIFVVAALLVVYFESRLREQNHRLKTMLSLVTTLAEDTNAIKHKQVKTFFNPKISLDDELIDVSDGDESEDDCDEDSEDEGDDDCDDDCDEDSEDEGGDLCLNDLEEDDCDEVIDLCLNDLEDDSESESDSEYKIKPDSKPELDCENVIKLDQNTQNIKVLKINIINDSQLSDNEEDKMTSSEQTDEYKHMPVAKLRQIATEKGIENAIKLKKNDLLKILL